MYMGKWDLEVDLTLGNSDTESVQFVMKEDALQH
jgi:hypothetical protein